MTKQFDKNLYNKHDEPAKQVVREISHKLGYDFVPNDNELDGGGYYDGEIGDVKIEVEWKDGEKDNKKYWGDHNVKGYKPFPFMYNT